MAETAGGPLCIAGALPARRAVFARMPGEEFARPRPDGGLVARLKRTRLAAKDRLHQLALATGRPSHPAMA